MSTILLEPGMPRLFTALAEWIACLICIYPLRKRFGKTVTVLIAVAALAGQVLLQLWAGTLPFALWIFGTVINIIFMWIVIFGCCVMNWKDAVYWCASALVASEVVASLEW